jgi:hypothetical protein
MTEPEDVVVVLVGARRAQHDEIPAATEFTHADVVLVDVVAAALQDDQSACRSHHVGSVAGHVNAVGLVAAAEIGGARSGHGRDAEREPGTSNPG